MVFSDLGNCPFCSCDEFYIKKYISGIVEYAERFDGKQMDTAKYHADVNSNYHNGKAYCRQCGKYLGNKETDELSKTAERFLRDRGVV